MTVASNLSCAEVFTYDSLLNIGKKHRELLIGAGVDPLAMTVSEATYEDIILPVGVDGEELPAVEGALGALGNATNATSNVTRRDAAPATTPCCAIYSSDGIAAFQNYAHLSAEHIAANAAVDIKLTEGDG